MCGRYTLTQSGEAIAAAFDLADVPTVSPRYNIAPTQPAAVVRAGEADREFTYLYWGLIPSWSKDPSIGARLINARSETVTEKPSFRAAFKRRRCLIVADGFYEWQRLPKRKQPYYFQLVDRQPFALAGLWEHWETGNGDVIDSCTILTTVANAVLEPVHDRMPVVLPPDTYDLWLDPQIQQPDRLLPLLRPYPAEAMQSYPVSLKVNSPKNDTAECIQPLDQSTEAETEPVNTPENSR
ncbi:SOS response-associated peptidase [Thermocoleostomius sinensis]|jgi:putative SOS response-associated peptidase YedK|uniref:Abasic site processing protein n=1 Tax=Thermocoleostomius sinensis A174 TaxID=2016057 RepID=A0A9E9C7S6_9CYAN|nr:SOS response-associated peptidase [Thermocoleostomius sinensis]WAL60664.1 SOS response-associated peptidase [Thermocoleostomius sinensis A174]